MITDKDLIEKLNRRHSKMVARRALYEPDWEDIIDFTQPNREAFGKEEEGMRIAEKIYDGTAQMALRLMANGFGGYATSRHMKWFETGLADREIEELPDVKEWLEDLDDHLYAIFQDSNFYNQMYPFYTDAGSVATATVYVEDDYERGRPWFSTRHPLELFIEQNRYQQVDTVHRDYLIPAREIVAQFGEDKASREVMHDFKNNPDKQYIIRHCVFENTKEMLGKLDNDKWDYASIYYLPSGKDKECLERSGYYENPYAVWRWSVNSRELYGRGPSHEALVATATINEMGKSLLQAAHMSSEPAYMAPHRLFGDLHVYPGGFNYLKPDDKDIKAINSGIAYPIGVDREDRIAKAIRDAYYVDFFIFVAQWYTQLRQAQKTATEVIKMEGEQAALLSSILGRLQSEALDRVFDRVFSIEQRAGRLPPLPEALWEHAGERIKIRYIGPLFQAQNRIFRTQGPMMALHNGMPLIEKYPQLADIVDWDIVFRDLMEGYGMPQKALRNSREVKRIRAIRAKDMAEQKRLAKLAAIAEAAPKLGKATEEGSPLAQIEEAAREEIIGAGV